MLTLLGCGQGQNGSYINTLINSFKTRVLADGGTFEAETNLDSQLNNIGKDLFDSASLVITPNGVKTSKLYAIKPDNGSGDLTVVRATTATRVNESGNIVDVPANTARIDYSTDKGLILVEPQRTNLFLRSEEFTSVNWLKPSATVTANVDTSPNGNNNAFSFNTNIDGSSTRHRLNQPLTLTIGTTYTGTYYLKAKDHQWVQLCGVVGYSTGVWANFDLVNGVIGNKGADAVASIQNIGNGWYRCSVTGVATQTSSYGIELIATNNTNSARYPSYQSLEVTKVCYVWGAQLEAGSNATSYIPTTTAVVTRNADIISKSGLSGITTITETFENGTTNVISGSPTTYQMSNDRIKQVIGK